MVPMDRYAMRGVAVPLGVALAAGLLVGPTSGPPQAAAPRPVTSTGAGPPLTRADVGRLDRVASSTTSIVAGSMGYLSMSWTAPAGGFTGTLVVRLPVEFGGARDARTATGWRVATRGGCGAAEPALRAPRSGSGVGATIEVDVRCGPGTALRLDVTDLRAPTRAGPLTAYAAVRPAGSARSIGVPGGAAVWVVAAVAARLVVTVAPSVRAGQVLRDPVLVTVQDEWGNRVTSPSYLVSLTAYGRGRPAALAGTTSAATRDGVAAIRGLVLPAPSRGVVLRASAGTPLGGRPPAEGESRPLRVLGPPAALRVVAGDGQGAPAGTVLPERPAVRVTDRVGNALPGLAVAFDVTSYGSSWRMVPTDTDGVARTPWRLGPRAGRHLLTASAGGLSAVLAALASGRPARIGSHRG